MISSYLFVYGTLMKKCKPNQWSEFLHQNAVYLGEGITTGKLFKIDFYPGLVEDENGEVYGEVYLLKNEKEVLSRLDEYEDYFPENLKKSLYLRKIKPIYLKDEIVISSWTYVFNQSTENKSLYPNGRFVE